MNKYNKLETRAKVYTNRTKNQERIENKIAGCNPPGNELSTDRFFRRFS